MSSFVKKTGTAVSKEGSNAPIKALILPVYVILSVVFIVYIGYSYATGVVYNTGELNGQQQGYDAGYSKAISDLLQQAGTQCEPVAITLGDQGVNVINVACLQAAPQAAPEAEVSE